MIPRNLCFVLRRNIAYISSLQLPFTYGHAIATRRRNPFFDPRYEESVWGPQPRCVLGGKHQVTMALGIGMSPELMDVVRRVFLCANAPIDFEVIDFGEDVDEKDLEDLIFSVERNGVAIKGNFLSEPAENEVITMSLQLKRALDLCVNLVEIKSYHSLVDKTRLKNFVDTAIICPNSEGTAAGFEYDNGKCVMSLRIITQYTSQRVAEFAFNYAIKNHRRKVTLVYNKGIMNWAEGTIVEAVSDVAVRYPSIPFHKQSMKAFIFKMKNFSFNGDVIVTMPIYAGLIKNILFGLMHGTGLYCAQNLGSRYAVFELASRNKGYKMAGKDIANPLAALDGGVKLLHYLGHHESAEKIRRAVDLTVNKDGIHTFDMMGKATLSEIVANIERRIREVMPEGYRGEQVVLQPRPPLTSEK